MLGSCYDVGFRPMGGCQSYGPFWVPIIIRHLIFRVPKKGTIILITTPMNSEALQPVHTLWVFLVLRCGFLSGGSRVIGLLISPTAPV